MSALFDGPVLRVHQPIGEFWLAAIPASILLKVAGPDPLRLLVDPAVRAPRRTKSEWPVRHLGGNQRPIEERRLREIAQYIDTFDATFPNSIIISANGDGPESDEEDESPGAEWVVEKKKDGQHRLVIPENPRKASIVDGQHRLYAFLRSDVPERREQLLVCSIFLSMPRAMQAMVFATINTNQKQVRRGLAMNLYGYNVEDEPRERWSPEKLAVFITRRLNFDPDSALHNRIKIEALDAPVPDLLPGAIRAIPTAAVVDGVMGLISKNPKRDRNELKSSRFLNRKSRSSLAADAAPFRRWYTSSSDAAFYDVVREFVRVADEVVWAREEEHDRMLKRAVGIRALFDFFGQLVNERLSPPTEAHGAAVSSYAAQCSKLVRKALTAAMGVDFADGFFGASGQGQTHIANVFSLASEMVTLEQLPERDQSEYKRLLKERS